jgi:hypothetical protein
MYQDIFHNMNLLITDLRRFIYGLGHLQPQEKIEILDDLDGIQINFPSKIVALDIMRINTIKSSKKLQNVFNKERNENKIRMGGIGRAIDETNAFFEAYLNALYSTLQIIAKLTPYFYKDYSPSITMKCRYFSEQIKWLRDNGNADQEYLSYIENNLDSWYNTFSNYRNAITHRASFFIGFEKDGSIVFLKPPEETEKLYWIKSGKPSDILEKYVNKSFQDFFNFLEFYFKHFRDRIPKSDFTKMVEKRLE